MQEQTQEQTGACKGGEGQGDAVGQSIAPPKILPTAQRAESRARRARSVIGADDSKRESRPVSHLPAHVALWRSGRGSMGSFPVPNVPNVPNVPKVAKVPPPTVPKARCNRTPRVALVTTTRPRAMQWLQYGSRCTLGPSSPPGCARLNLTDPSCVLPAAAASTTRGC